MNSATEVLPVPCVMGSKTLLNFTAPIKSPRDVFCNCLCGSSWFLGAVLQFQSFEASTLGSPCLSGPTLNPKLHRKGQDLRRSARCGAARRSTGCKNCLTCCVTGLRVISVRVRAEVSSCSRLGVLIPGRLGCAQSRSYMSTQHACEMLCPMA